MKGAIRNYKSYLVIPQETVGKKVDIELGQTSGTNTIACFLREHEYGEIEKDYDIGQVSAMTSAIKRHSVSIGDSLTETEAKLFEEHYVALPVSSYSLKQIEKYVGFNPNSSNKQHC